MADTVTKLAKNVKSTATLTVKGGSTFLTVITNPWFWVFIGLLFFPLNIFNYIVLFIVNGLIMIGNIFIFIAQLIIFLILNGIIIFINFLIDMVNAIKFSIHIPWPVDEDIDFGFPDMPHLSYLTFPSFGIIPYLDINQTTILPNKVLLLWFFELMGISLL